MSYTKDHYYATRFTTLAELKTEIICIFDEIDAAMLVTYW